MKLYEFNLAETETRPKNDKHSHGQKVLSLEDQSALAKKIMRLIVELGHAETEIDVQTIIWREYHQMFGRESIAEFDA